MRVYFNSCLVYGKFLTEFACDELIPNGCKPTFSLDDKQAEWKSRLVTFGEVNRHWTEGSYIFKANNLYYMMYSSNYFVGKNYAVGYATSKSPLGPFEIADNNPVLQQNLQCRGIVTGIGNNSITVSPDGKKCFVLIRDAPQKEEIMEWFLSMKWKWLVMEN